MTYFAITAQYPVFTDLDGTPLEDGYIYIGQPNGNPITNPIRVCWDAALLYPVTQPIRTLAGAPNRNGSPSPIYCASNFSIEVKDKNLKHIYYSPSGVKNYTDEITSDDNKNYLINGNFNIFQNYPEIDMWLKDVNKDTITLSRLWFDFGQQEVPDSPSYYISLTTGTSTDDDAYSRYVNVIENVSLIANETVTLSFYAKASALTKFAVSFTQRFFTSANDVEGIGATVFYPTEDWQLYQLTITIPDISDLTYPFEAMLPWFLTGTFVNFWLSSGADEGYQNANLGYNPSAGILYLADIRLNKGTTRRKETRTYAEELRLVERYFETSYNGYQPQIGIASAYTNAEYRIAHTAKDDLEGFQCRTSKRPATSPVITIYDPDTGNSGYVDRIGTGPVQVDTIAFEGTDRVPLVALLATTVAGDYYRYHWVYDAQFTI